MRVVQHFTREQLLHGRTMKPEQIVRFLDDFRRLHGGLEARQPQTSTLISLRVPDDLLRLFKARAAAQGQRYQAQIKALMEAWVKEG